MSNDKFAIFYDVNGHNGPNQWGIDFFEFSIKNEKIYPKGIPGIETASFNDGCQKTINDGYYCAAWVIYKGNMDYLHCDGLTWNSKSCQDK